MATAIFVIYPPDTVFNKPGGTAARRRGCGLPKPDDVISACPATIFATDPCHQECYTRMPYLNLRDKL
ncbi:hypothetical protein EB241_05820 [Erwinia psidii]|uniref:Uncharacterized protein n=1 Tax=Erwinia psidii TaxID=69224 RepID=A0A3N6SCX4_9GAMM|nr:hypothetical protein EB241_05820 [Erwinia psidii]